MKRIERLKYIRGRFRRRLPGLGSVLALLLAVLTALPSARAAGENGAIPMATLANKPEITIQGNVVVDESGAPTGFYELALCVRSPRRISGPDPANPGSSKELSEAEYAQVLADIEAGTATVTEADYTVTYYPFSAASAVVNVNTDVLTAVNWDVQEVKYAAWDGTAYADADADYPRGVDKAASADSEQWGPTDPAPFPNVTLATMDKYSGRNPVALDAEGDRSAFTAAAQADYYYTDATSGTKAAVVTLSAHAPDNKPVVYKTSTPVVVVRFSYDLKRFPKGIVKTNDAYNTTNPLGQITGDTTAGAAQGFWLGLSRNNTDPIFANGKTPITWLADTAMDGAGAPFSFSDQIAAQTADGQVVWTKLSSKDTAGEYLGWDQTEYYYYLGAQSTGSNGTVGTENVYNSATGTFDLVEHIKLPATQGTKVLGHGSEENPEPDTAAGDTWSKTGFSYYSNILHLNSNVKLNLVNDLTFKKPTGGTGGNQILFYDWDDTLIGTLVVGDGDVRAQVNAYIEKTMVHPDLRVGDTLKTDLGGNVPDYSAGAPAAGSAAEKYKNVLDSLDREYTYRGKYPYELGGSAIQDDPTDLPGSEYPLTNKLDYAFYRHLNTVTTQEYTDATTGATITDRYVTAEALSSNQDAAQFPWVYGWAVVEDNGAYNNQEWQVRRDAMKREDVWTTFGVGELSNLDPSFDLTTPGAQAIPAMPGAPAAGTTVGGGTGVETTYPSFIDPTAATAPSDYSYKLSSAGDARYLRFADFSDIGAEYTRPGQDTLIVKAVYEPGPELLKGYNYSIGKEAYYNKLNGRAANNGGAYSVELVLERVTYEHADGLARGASRVRDPAVRQDTTYDQKWIESLALGVDHNLDNADLATAAALSETMFTNVEVISGDEVGVTLSLSARQNTASYFLIEKYGWNFVAGGLRSANTLLMAEGEGRLLNNYNYDSTDSNTSDIYYDVTQYEDRDGSRGFVLEGTLNYLMDQATQVNRGRLDLAQFRTNADYAEIRDANLRMDALGTQPETGLPFFSMQEKFVDAAKACEAQKSNPDFWNAERDCAELSYHQLQLYILNGSLTGRAAADATPISWCHLHKTCADMSSGAPKTWQEIMDAAADPAKQDTIEKMAVADIENITGLRMNAAGTKYTNLTTFKNDIVDAVAGLNAKGMPTTWLNVQYAILVPAAPDTLDEAQAKANFWWYDSSLAAKPTARNLSDLVTAAQDYYDGATLKDGNTVAGWTVKMNGLEAAFAGNQTSDGSIGADWLKLTENLVKTWTVNADDTEDTSPYHDGVMTYEAFQGELLPAIKKGIDAGETNDPAFWNKLQYVLLHPTEPWPAGVSIGDGSPQGDELARYWWHNGGKLLVVTDMKTMFEVAAVADTDGASAWSKFDYTKFSTGSGFTSIQDLKFQFDGTQPIDASNFDTFKAQVVSFVKNSGQTDFDPVTNLHLWKYLQYWLIHGNLDTALALDEFNAGYYWWQGGATEGTTITFDSEVDLTKAAFLSKVNGNTAAWDNLTDGFINNMYFRKPAAADLDADTYAAHTDMPALSMADLKTAVEALVTDRLASDTTGHGHTPPTLSWLDIQHYVVTGDKDWTDDFADETAAKGRYWWHSGGRNPNAKNALQTLLEEIDAAKGDPGGVDGFIDAMAMTKLTNTDISLRVLKTAKAIAGTTNIKNARTRLKSLYAQAGSNFTSLTWYQVQYAMSATTAAQGKGGAGAYMADAAQAKTWYANNLTAGTFTTDWRPQWLKDADPLT